MTHLIATLAAVPFASRSMAEQMTLVVHITAGTLGIIVGFVALFVKKGAPLHRKSGMLFVYALVTMGVLGAIVAAVWDRSAFANVPVGLFTAYLAVTALTTVRPPSRGSGQLDFGLMMVPLSMGLTLAMFGVEAVMSPRHMLHGFPAAPLFLFAGLALVAMVGDLRMIRSGGVQALRGSPRIGRHLWRMSLALAIAAFSGFPRIIPAAYRTLPVIMIPPLVVFVAMFYWLWRVRVRRRLRGIVRVSVPEPGTRIRPAIAS